MLQSIGRKVYLFFINALFWMWLCRVPAGILGFVAFLMYNHSHDHRFFSVIIAALGIFLGYRFAEYVRKK
jgi:hypothetical protein